MLGREYAWMKWNPNSYIQIHWQNTKETFNTSNFKRVSTFHLITFSYTVWSISVHAFVPCAKQRFATWSKIPLYGYSWLPVKIRCSSDQLMSPFIIEMVKDMRMRKTIIFLCILCIKSFCCNRLLITIRQKQLRSTLSQSSTSSGLCRVSILFCGIDRD